MEFLPKKGDFTDSQSGIVRLYLWTLWEQTMITKFISLATGIVLLDVYLQSQLYSNDPLFLFASNNLVINAGLLIIVGLMVVVSFKDKFRHWWSYIGSIVISAVFGITGIIGLFFSNLLYSIPQVLLPLDYMFLLEAAVVFGICSLSYQHAKVPIKLNLPKLLAFFTNFAFPVPKIPQSPTPRSRGPQPA
ncbi:hypothetical protein KW794_01630 [Candidatus Saccharibacteria bacterium]|nr:hypothetical protein [Candidatus Saccharibacteria bacterium]